MAAREVHIAVEPARQVLKFEFVAGERRWSAERR